jgi:dTDP-4-amino-4,6-dideoxygalactose transaminase
LIPYGRQSLDEQDIENVVQALKSNWLTTGPFLGQFEDAIAQEVNAPFATAVANGTLALHLAILSLDLKPGFKGITSPLTFAASANAILYAGGQLDLIDICPNHPGIDVDALEKYCKEVGPPDVVISVAYGGWNPDLAALHQLSQKEGFKIIEDASHALGSHFKHQGELYKTGDGHFSDLTTFSFHPVKNITTAEGGLITTKDAKLNERLRDLRHHGITKNKDRLKRSNPPPWYYEIESLGFNARLSELHAALGVSQMSKLMAFKSKRKFLADRYTSFFRSEELPVATPFDWDHPFDQQDPFLHLYPMRARNEEERDGLYKHLHSKGIFTQVHYIPIHHHSHFQEHLPKGTSFPEANRCYEGLLSLPLYPDLSTKDQDHVINSILMFYRQ